MAKERKRSSRTASDLQGHTDPRAPLDSAKLLAAARPVLLLLGKDLLARAKDSPAVTTALEARHAAEQAARRTADPFLVWQTNLVDQVAAAWMLSCVFVRILEDRGLIAQPRLAGAGAADSQRLFFELAPSLTERDYLLTVFRELSRFPAARDLFDARHNPVWLLTPSAEAAKALLGLFRLPSPDAPAFRFGQADTRFLGDLYQDLNEDVQKRYALLQTPRFVESFILDRTLERAIERFGLDETTLIDPTCGSGHFLLGAFDRLFNHRMRAEPGIDVREAARRALDAVYGADINPYAIAIARFRLTLAYLEKAAFAKLADAPVLPLHLVVADSLLHNAQVEQASFQELLGQSAKAWGGEEFALEDETAAREVLHRRYAAVVGNPPYITVKDAVLRERYREMYIAAAGKYSVAAPFTQRFFQLARDRGSVGMITANSFMKREFGKKLIEEYLPSVNVDLIVNTSGAYIPGHGTPTVLLFGTAEPPQGPDVLAVLAKRGEPTTPSDAEQGLVWRSIADHWAEVGFDNDYLSVARIERSNLAKHPWSLGGGGAAELKELLEERAGQRLGELADSIGITSFTLEDDVYLRPRSAWRRLGVPESRLRPMVIGEAIRDWSVGDVDDAFFPYDDSFSPLQPTDDTLVALWPYRTGLSNNMLFGGKTKVQGGLKWYEFGRLTADKLRTPLTITFAFVATHNHFVLDRGGKVFKQSAPVIKLPEGATEDEHLALLAYLNSSTACFWMKQVFQPKGSATRDAMTPENNRHEFAGTPMQELPLPQNWRDDRLVTLARAADDAARCREQASPAAVIANDGGWSDTDSLADALSTGKARHRKLLQQLAFLQEEIDWLVYALYGICETPQALQVVGVDPELHRPFSWSDGIGPRDVPRILGDLYRERRQAIESVPHLALIEDRAMKRLWRGTSGDDGRYGVGYDEQTHAAAVDRLLELVEVALSARTDAGDVRSLAASLQTDPRFAAVASLCQTGVATDPLSVLRRIVDAGSVPFLTTHTYTDGGLVKRAAWESVWALQRREDAGEPVGTIPVGPAYSQGSRGKATDFARDEYWDMRGKLDVPKERFISYPGCESDQDGEPIYGWAGWNHLQQAQALAALYQKRKNEEAWGKDRLTPMLAGLLELLPWIKQWHNEPSDEFNGMRLGDFFEGFLDGECRSLGLTHDDLRAWRPADKKRGKGAGKAKKATSKATPVEAEPEGDSAVAAETSASTPAKGSAAAKKAWATRRKRKDAEAASDEE